MNNSRRATWRALGALVIPLVIIHAMRRTHSRSACEPNSLTQAMDAFVHVLLPLHAVHDAPRSHICHQCALNTSGLLSLCALLVCLQLSAGDACRLFLAQNAHVCKSHYRGFVYVNLHNIINIYVCLCIKHTRARAVLQCMEREAFKLCV
jgi:hypothetical protein